MNIDDIVFIVAYEVASASDPEKVVKVNECEFNAKEAVKYFAEHDIDLPIYNVYNTKYVGKKSYPIPEPYVALTRAGQKLVDSLGGPVSYCLTIERDNY